MNVVKDKIRKFMESYTFLVILAGYLVVSWIFDIVFPTFILATIVLFILILLDGKMPCIILVMMMYLGSHRDNGYDFSSPWFVVLMVIAGVSSLLLIYKTIKNIRFKISGIMLSLIIMNLVMIISTAVSEHKAHTFGCSVVFFLNIVFSFAEQAYIKRDKEAIDKLYFSVCLLPFVMFFQYLYKFTVEFNIFKHPEQFDKYMHLSLGYLISNFTIVLDYLATVLGIYMFSKGKGKLRWFYLTSIVMGVLMAAFSLSRSGYGAFIICAPIYVVTMVVMGFLKKKDFAIIVGTILAALGVGVIVVNIIGIEDAFLRIYEKGSHLSGREVVWNVAIEQFNKHWFLGTGWQTSKFYLHEIGWNLYNYHGHLYQASTCGIVGIASLGLFLTLCVRRLTIKDPMSVSVLFILAYYLVHGAFDTIIYNKLLFPMFIVILESTRRFEYTEVYEDVLYIY